MYDTETIKIDRRFVLAQENAKGVKVMTGLLRFSEEVDLGVVEEGEPDQKIAALAREKALIVQGRYCSKALPGDVIGDFVR